MVYVADGILLERFALFAKNFMFPTMLPFSTVSLGILALCTALQGCTVLAIADTVGSVAVRTAGAAASVAVSAASTAAEVTMATTRIGAKAVGAAAEAAVPIK